MIEMRPQIIYYDALNTPLFFVLAMGSPLKTSGYFTK